MAVEVAEADFTGASVKDGAAILKEKDSTKPNQVTGLDNPIELGLQGKDVPIKLEGHSVLDVSSITKDVNDDTKLKAQIDQVAKEVLRFNKSRFPIIDALKAKKLDLAQVKAQLESVSLEKEQHIKYVDLKRKEMEKFQQSLVKLSNENDADPESGDGLCSSEEELDGLIKSLNYQMQHESHTLAEEKQLIREIKQLKGSRKKVIAKAAVKMKVQVTLEDQIKQSGCQLDVLRKEQEAIRAKIKNLKDEKNAIDNELSSLEEELTTTSQNADNAYETLLVLKKRLNKKERENRRKKDATSQSPTNPE